MHGDVRKKLLVRGKSKKTLRNKLRKVFHEWVRFRDRDKGCISCVKGKVENAGHFRSVGRAPQPSMAFDERNVNGQCIRCNYTLGGNEAGYKKGLILRYGKGIIQQLDVKRSQRQNPWTPFEYESLIKYYQDDLKKQKKESSL